MRSISRVVPWLVVVLALVQVGAELPVVHAHGGASAGIHNEECSLERMMMAPGGAIIIDAPDAGVSLLARPISLAPGDPAPATRATLPSGSRSPPTS
jgi:hypothetical protein